MGMLKARNARVNAHENFRPRPFPVITPTIPGHAYCFLDGAHHQQNKKEQES